MVTPDVLLQYLPPYMGREIVINRNQDVADIVTEVLKAHDVFAGDYDIIAPFFNNPDQKKMLENLFDFCKRYIKYKIEPEEDQTTRSPAAILAMGSGDCKHYAGFIGGVLGSLERAGKKIDWNYRFASYDFSNKIPGHVFVVAGINKNEIWIDPVLDEFNENLEPAYITDKKTSDMLKRISGIEFDEDQVIDYPISDALDQTAGDAEAYKTVQTLLKYGVMNLDTSLNDEVIPALQNQIPAADFQQLQTARVNVERMALSGLGENVLHALNQVAMAIPRAAYLSLVGLNVFGLATKLSHALFTDPAGGVFDPNAKDKLYHVWYKLGGNFDKLVNTVRHGRTKKAILGVAPAIPAWVATASAIIAALAPIIASILKDRQAQTGVDYNIDPTTGLPYGQAGGPSPFGTGGGILDFLKNNPFLVVGIAGAAYLLFFYKKRSA